MKNLVYTNNTPSNFYLTVSSLVNSNYKPHITLYPVQSTFDCSGFIWQNLLHNALLTLKSHYWAWTSVNTLYTNTYANLKLTYSHLPSTKSPFIFSNNRLLNSLRSPIQSPKTHNSFEKKLLSSLGLRNRRYKTLSVLTRYLPYINLVRLLRFFHNKKSINYFISSAEFIKSLLIRINSNYKLFKFSESLGFKKTFLQSPILQGFSLLSVLNSNDNFIEVSPNQIKPHLDTTSYSLTQYRNSTTPSSFLFFDHFSVKNLLDTPTLFKFIMSTGGIRSLTTNNFSMITSSINKYSFNSRVNIFKSSNIYPSTSLNFTIKRKVLKIFSYNKFSPNITMWYYNTLIRFIENCSGKKCFLKFNPFIDNCLTFSDIARCNLWSLRISTFQKILGPKIFLQESLRIMHLAIRFKDPTFFSNWIRGMLNRMSFWKYRLLFRYIKFAMRYLFWIYFPELKFKGLKLKLKGKISVAGNARTRTLVYKIGETGYSKLNNRVLSDFSLINTFTGVLGFKIWFFF